MPTSADLDALYAASWSEPDQHVGETGGTDDMLAQTYAHCLAADLGRADLGGLRILDFGAGDGAMSAALAALGARVTAVEPYGQPRSFGGLIDVFARLEDLPHAHAERFDGIVCLQVIEHLPQPRPVLEALHQLLDDGGWLLLTTPNAASLRARLTGQRWTEVRKPGHVVLFGERSLRALLARLGGWQDVRRPAWRVQYSRQPLNAGLQVLLQRTGLGGDLRCLAFKRSAPDASHG